MLHIKALTQSDHQIMELYEAEEPLRQKAAQPRTVPTTLTMEVVMD